MSDDPKPEEKSKRLTGAQQRALDALLVQPTIKEAAKTAGCGDRSLRRWLKDPVFAQAYQEARAEVRRAVTNRLASVAGKAVAALEGVLDDEAAPHGSVVAAAKVVLSELHGAASQEALEERLAQLESKARS